MFDRRGQRAFACADRQPRRLLTVVHTAQGDATVAKVGEIEGCAMDDSADALQELEGLCAGLGDVDDRDARPAAIDLHQADFGSVRIEAGGRGIVDLGVQRLEPGVRCLGNGVDLGLWRLRLFRRLTIAYRLGVDGLPLSL